MNAMKNKGQQALHLQGLEPIAETLADTHSYGFRPERSTADAIEQWFKVLNKADAPEWILESDITSCFDQLWVKSVSGINGNRDGISGHEIALNLSMGVSAKSRMSFDLNLHSRGPIHLGGPRGT